MISEFNIAYIVRNEQESNSCQKMLFNKKIFWDQKCPAGIYKDLEPYPSIIYVWRNDQILYGKLDSFFNECELVEYKKLLREQKLKRIL
jgi:hypothetical protein